MKQPESITKLIAEEQKIVDITGWVLRIAVVLCIVVLNVCLAAAQNQRLVPRAGLGIGYVSSGSGHGCFFSPGAIIAYGRSEWKISPVLHKRSGLVKGGRLAWVYNLTAPRIPPVRFQYDPEIFAIELLGFAQYNEPLPLSYNLVKEEGLIQSAETADWNAVAFSTLEAGAGFQFKIGITTGLSWKTYVAASAYRHLNYAEEIEKTGTWMNHPRCAIVLGLGTSINYLF